MLVSRPAGATAIRRHLRAASLRCADLGARSQDRELLEHALRRGLGWRTQGRRRLAAERGAVRLLARFELHPVLGGPAQYRCVLRVGRDHLAAGGGRGLRRAADGQGAALQPGRDRRVHRGPGPRPMELSIHRLRIQGLGRRRRRGLLLLPGWFWHEGREPQGRPQERLRAERVHHPDPKGAYPFDVLPDDPVDALFLDGRKHAYRFPNPVGDASRTPDRRRAGNLSAAVRQGRGARGRLLQSEPDGAATRGLRAVLRSGRDGHALLLGESLAAGAGELDRPDDRRPDRPHADPQ